MDVPFPKALIFDWDNTLVDSWGNILEGVNRVRKSFGLAPWDMAMFKDNGGGGRAARELFPEWFGADWEKACDTYYQSLDDISKTRDVKLMPGAHELLHWLKVQQIPLFVVSNKRGDRLRAEAEKLGWHELFISIAGVLDSVPNKPAREHVDYALNHAGIIADTSVWFVGDSEIDVQCARNSGCTPVFIGDPAEAAALSVNLCFSDCHALQRLLYNRSKNEVA